MQAFLHKQMRTPSPYCPICTNSFLPETAAHVLTCQHPSAIAACLTTLDQCIKIRCKSANTSPIILHCWDECLHCELGLPDKPQHHKFQHPPWIEAAVKEARQHQNIIGWNGFIRGIISSKWIHAQHLHLKAFPSKDPKHGKGWAYTSTKHILQLGIHSWKWRNEYIYGKTIQENRAKACKSVIVLMQIHHLSSLGFQLCMKSHLTYALPKAPDNCWHGFIT